MIVVHFPTSTRKLDQAVTMHPHGVRYNPEYDGAYYGDLHAPAASCAGRRVHLRVGGDADSVGVWPYHDHGPNHTLNTLRGYSGQ